MAAVAKAAVFNEATPLGVGDRPAGDPEGRNFHLMGGSFVVVGEASGSGTLLEGPVADVDPFVAGRFHGAGNTEFVGGLERVAEILACVRQPQDLRAGALRL